MEFNLIKKFDFFSFISSSSLLKAYIQVQQKNGRGLVQKIAEQLSIASPQVSQFLSGAKIPTIDQAYRIARFFAWTETELEYWLALIELERAAHHEVKAYFRQKLENLRSVSREVSASTKDTVELSDHAKSQFYSSWIYSALRLFCSIEPGKSIEEIKKTFPEFDRADLLRVIEFLLKHQLLLKEGLFYKIGTQRTFITRSSPYITQHHSNWRIRAIERSRFISEEELIFTAPLSISKSGFKKIRRQLQEFIQDLYENLDSHGEAEVVACINLDFFEATLREKVKKS